MNYDSGTYANNAYYVYQKFSKSATPRLWNFNSFDITTNSTRGRIFYKTYNDLAEAGQQDKTKFWIDAGQTINGTQTITVNRETVYMDIAVVWDSILWTDDDKISGITVSSTEIRADEVVYKDVFYLDTPQQVDPRNGFSFITCSGRNIWKRANETDINVEDLTAGVAIDALIKSGADKVGIPYTASSIADLSAIANRTLSTGYGDKIKVEKLFEDLMSIIQDDYQMYMEYDDVAEDNVLFVQLKPVAFEASFVFNFNRYIQLTKKKDYGRLLQRLTVLSDDAVVTAEELLDSEITQTGTGAQSFTWSGEAIYKRITFETSADGFTAVIDNVSNEIVNFTVTAGTGTGTWTARVYGNKFSGSPPTAAGESVNSANMLNNKGITSRITNKLVLSDAEAETIAEGFVNAFGDPVFQITVQYPYLNILMETNDQILIWAKNLFTDDLYIVNGYKIKWNEFRDSILFNLEDSGRDFGDEGGFIYDRSGLDSGIPDIKYDKGFLYDMVFGVGADPGDVDPTKYKNDITFS